MEILKIIIDIIIVMICVFSVFLGIRRGFVKSFFKSTKLLLVILVTMIIGSLVVSLCANSFVGGMIEGKISDKLVLRAEQSGAEFNFEMLEESIPEVVKNIVPMQEIEQHFVASSGNNVEVARSTGEKIEEVLIAIASNVIGYILAFIIAFIICSFAIWLIEKFFEFPVLNWVNHLAGVFWGIASAYLVSSFIACVVALILGNEFVNGTLITRIIYNIGLFSF